MLLLSEVLVLSGRFDAQAIVDRGTWWGPLVAYARYVPQGLMAAVAAALVLARPWTRPSASRPSNDGTATEAVPTPSSSCATMRPRVIGLGAHLLAFVVLAVLTQAVWEGPLGRSAWGMAWFLAWWGTGLVVLGTWALAALPARTWALLARRSAASGVLLAVLAVGAGACLVGHLTGALWQPLGRATLWSVRGVLGLFFRDVVFLPGEAVVGTAAFHVEVAASCSGYEGIGLIWAFLAGYLIFFRRELRFPQALWLLPLGTAVMWLANVARIAALIALGTLVSPEIALGGFHSQAGWLAFNAVALGLVILSRRLRVFAVDGGPMAGDSPSDRPIHPAVAQLAPLLALVATVMITTALSPRTGIDILYPMRVVAVAAVLIALRGAYGPIALGELWSWPALAIGVAVFGIWLVLEPAPAGPEASTAMAATLRGWPPALAFAWLAFRVVGSVVTVPIAEELAFRGYLIRRLVARDVEHVEPGRFTWPAFLGSSLLFGLLHGRWLAGTLAGLLYALALRRRGRLGDAILAHGVTNALIAADVLLTGAWTLWV